MKIKRARAQNWQQLMKDYLLLCCHKTFYYPLAFSFSEALALAARATLSCTRAHAHTSVRITAKEMASAKRAVLTRSICAQTLAICYYSSLLV